MAYVFNHSDRVGKTKLCSKQDMDILSSHANAQSVKDAKVIRYVRAELCRIAESAKTYKSQEYINKCEEIKRNLSENNQEFEAKCKSIIDSFVVEAALNCRIDKGSVDYHSMTKYLQPLFECVYGRCK